MSLFACCVLPLVPGPVVTSVDHQGVLAQSQFVERVEQTTSFIVELFDDISIQATSRLAAKAVRSIDDGVHHRMGEIQQKRFFRVPLLLQIGNRPVRIERDQLAHLLAAACRFLILMESDLSAVVRSQWTKVVIKALGIRHPLEDRFPIGDVPLADAGGLVT